MAFSSQQDRYPDMTHIADEPRTPLGFVRETWVDSKGEQFEVTAYSPVDTDGHESPRRYDTWNHLRLSCKPVLEIIDIYSRGY